MSNIKKLSDSLIKAIQLTDSLLNHYTDWNSTFLREEPRSAVEQLGWSIKIAREIWNHIDHNIFVFDNPPPVIAQMPCVSYHELAYKLVTTVHDGALYAGDGVRVKKAPTRPITIQELLVCNDDKPVLPDYQIIEDEWDLVLNYLKTDTPKFDANSIVANLRVESSKAQRNCAEVDNVDDSIHKRATANQIMLEKMQKDPNSHGWTAEQWSQYAKKSKSTIVNTPTWKKLKEIRDKLKAEKALDRRRKTRASETRRD